MEKIIKDKSNQKDINELLEKWLKLKQQKTSKYDDIKTEYEKKIEADFIELVEKELGNKKED
jgi:hypothetical protein